MSTTYTGNPLSSHAPASAPGEAIAPILTLPVDGDPGNAASVAQAFETLADYVAWLNSYASLKKYGIPLWDSLLVAGGWYGLNSIARDPVDGLVYALEIAGPTGSRPGLDTAHWIRYLPRLRARPQQWAEPIATWTNANNQRRFGIDHLGFPAGQIYQWNENWDLPLAQQFASTARWQSFLNSGTVAIFDPGGGGGLQSPFFRTVRVTPTTGATTATFITKNVNCEAFTSDDLVLVAEVAVAMSAIGANRTLVSFGIADAMNAGATRGLFISKAQGDTNWQFTSAESGTSNTGVPPVANTYQRLKIEFIGANVSDNGAARANCYIDGNLVSSIGTAVSNGSSLFPVFGAQTQTTGGAAVSAGYGPMRYRSNLSAGDVF